MKAGLLNTKVTIQQATEARDSYGEPVKTWSTYRKVWANVESLKGREFYDAQQVNPELIHKVIVRCDEDISPKMRISWNSTYLAIDSVRHFEKWDETVMICREWDE